MTHRIRSGLLLVVLLSATSSAAIAQAPPSNAANAAPQAPAPIEDTIDAAESEDPNPRRQLKSWNEYDGPLFSIRVGGGFLYEVMSEDGKTLVHLGLSARYGKPKDEKLRLRARPGAWPAPYFVDTGEFAPTGTTMTGLELYYRPGRWTFGSEFIFQQADAPEAGDLFFHGGEAFVSWMLTGETRTYNTRGGYFNQISPARSIYRGGPHFLQTRLQLQL